MRESEQIITQLADLVAELERQVADQYHACMVGEHGRGSDAVHLWYHLRNLHRVQDALSEYHSLRTLEEFCK